MLYRYKFIDDTEATDGWVESPDTTLAAVKALEVNERHRRHAVNESHLGKARGFELVTVTGYRSNSYSLDISLVGSRKKKWHHIYA